MAATEEYTDCLMKSTRTPGIAVAIVYKDRVVFLKGYGVRETGKPQKIDENTVFEIASLSKPLSSTILASLVGTHDISWDDLIVSLDPEFRLSDSKVTSQLTIRDLFSHRSGLPGHAGDELEELGYTRTAVLERLRYVPLTGKFRETYAYTNFGITEGAVAVAKKMNQRWEEIAEQRLFSRLAMTQSSYRFSDYRDSPNRAGLHIFQDGRPVERYVRGADAEAPAGGVSSSARDLSQWLRLQLADGKWNGRQIVDAHALGETREPIICTGKSTDGKCDAGVSHYGLGWNVSFDKNGNKVLSHSGAFFLGASTTVRFSPNDQVGIIVLSNTSPIGVPEAISLTFMDLFQRGRLQMRDWFGVVNPIFNQMVASAQNASPDYGTMAAPLSRQPSRPLASYVGRYFNPYYGEVEIVRERNTLSMLLPPLGAHYDLLHWNRDTFTFYIAGESSGIGRRGVRFLDGGRLLLQNYVAKDGSGKIYEDGIFSKVSH